MSGHAVSTQEPPAFLQTTNTLWEEEVFLKGPFTTAFQNMKYSGTSAGFFIDIVEPDSDTDMEMQRT